MTSAPVTYLPNFISDPIASEMFSVLWNNLDWERRGRRREYWTNTLDRNYTYGSGEYARTYEAKECPDAVFETRQKLFKDTGVFYEGCFLNGYNDRNDALSFHADDDAGINHAKPIAVITLGQSRAITFREVLIPWSEGVKPQYGPKESVMLEHGSLLLMHAGMQQTHQHAILPAGFEAKPRISLTFRSLVQE